MEWFNGTHVTRIVPDPRGSRDGFFIESAMADADGTRIGEWEQYTPSQSHYNRDLCDVYAEAIRYLVIGEG
jgi:hypothetical protein